MSQVGTRAGATREAPAVDTDSDTAIPSTAARARAPRALVIAGAVALVGLPLVVAVGALRRPQWYPVLDLTMTELRLRDVGTRHSPLIGLPGRIGSTLAEQGSHPGPLSFYVLAPLYRLFGSSAWAMQAATVVLHLGALATALVIAARRGGTRLVIVVGTLLAVLSSGYGAVALTQPWNPYLPLLWWVVLLLAVWSVLCGDLAMLPVAVAVGSFCAQTHVPYLGLALGLGGLVVAALVLARRRAGAGSTESRALLRWGAVALGLGVLLWVPPLVDQAINDPGNIRKIYDHLGTPPEEPAGLARGVELTLVHLDPRELATGPSWTDRSLLDASADVGASILPGVAFLVVWAGTGVAAVRLRHPSLLRLHVVTGASLVLAAVAMGRIFGKEWYYLMLWAWGSAMLALLAVGWTVVVLVGSRLSPPGRWRAANAGLAGLAAVTLVSTAFFTADATGVDPPEPHLSEPLGAVLPSTVAALERGEGAATGREGRYTVSWNDALHFGSQGFGLVGELERAGFDVGTGGVYHVPITDHRVIEPSEATAELHLATGGFVERWRRVPEAVEVAHVEPRSAAERAEFARLRSEVIDELRRDGLDDLVPLVDRNLFGVSIDDRVSVHAERSTARMLELGDVTAVFVTPPGVSL
ncbi:MAG: hypothetical protein ACLFXM_07845 [Acidimicrobiia bacterium]